MSSHTYLGNFNPSFLLLALVHCSKCVAGAVVVHQLSVTLCNSGLKVKLQKTSVFDGKEIKSNN